VIPRKSQWPIDTSPPTYWVEEMTAFAAEHGVESRLDLSLIPKLGHSAYGLLPYSQQAMGEALEQ
jgi:hypothetical protein